MFEKKKERERTKDLIPAGKIQAAESVKSKLTLYKKKELNTYAA